MIDIFFFFNDTATTEIYTLSLHDALPISFASEAHAGSVPERTGTGTRKSRNPRSKTREEPGDDDDQAERPVRPLDRKSTRLNSSHANISYAVFCLKKKKNLMLNILYLIHV